MAIPQAKPKSRPLTTKQRKFIRNKVKGMTGTAAAMDAYGASYDVARSMAAENLAKPSIQNAIEAEFDKQGITISAIVKPIKDGLDATRTVIVRDAAARKRLPGESDEAYEERQTDASFIDERPDLGTRMRAADMAAKFLGIGKKDPDPAQSPTTINFNSFNGKTYMKGE